jgi:hypothetical protein
MQPVTSMPDARAPEIPIRRMSRLLAPLVAALLGACAAAPPQAEAPGPVAAGGPTCAPALARAGALFEALPDRQGPGDCALRDAVRLTRSHVALDQPLQITCATAEHLLRFERDVVQPAALRHFGKPLARIRHFGGYACRQRNGDARGILSEHGQGRAIDIAGFDLADGTQITVARHWQESGPRGAFLRQVAREACSVFHLVLTPRTDALHRSHLHLDIGRWRRCDA